MKIGDLVLDRFKELSYIVEIDEVSKTITTFSPVPGRHQPSIYKMADVTLVEAPASPYTKIKFN